MSEDQVFGAWVVEHDAMPPGTIVIASPTDIALATKYVIAGKPIPERIAKRIAVIHLDMSGPAPKEGKP